MMDIQIYTTQTCAYCHAAKRLLKQKKLSYQEHDMSLNSNLRKSIMDTTGQRTVPQIFIDSQHIGGFEDLALHLRKIH
jgi:glutaredoxin 3